MVSKLIDFAIALSTAVVVLLALTACTEQVDEYPVIHANGEELHGSWADSSVLIAVFKGVPFAEPPIADMRWRAPAPNRPRSGPQNAREFAMACMQTPIMTAWYADVAKAFGAGPEVAANPHGVNEDCLYLNLWSPRLDSAARLPVLVWVHGGSNKGGWSYEPNYLGAKLAEKGVIVVTIAYRLGAFGFFSHPALDNDGSQPVANFGLLDIEHAIRWVRDNVDSFGGDPSNITLIGESAGAGNISDLLMSRMGEEPLYHRAILQSSASGLRSRRTLEEEQLLGGHLAESIGLEGTVTASHLRGVSAESLLTKSMTALPGHYFDAVIDHRTMQRSPLDTLRHAKSTKMEVLIGTNADEWLMYIDEKASLVDLEKIIAQNAAEQASSLASEVGQEADVRRAIDRVETAVNILCPSRYLAARITELGGRGWVYYFSRQRPGPGGGKLGAYHGTEIPYVFDTHDDWLPVDDTDRRLTEAVMDYWVQFARSGDPNSTKLPEWPVYSGQSPVVMELGDRIGVRKPNDARLCELLGPK